MSSTVELLIAIELITTSTYHILTPTLNSTEFIVLLNIGSDIIFIEILVVIYIFVSKVIG